MISIVIAYLANFTDKNETFAVLVFKNIPSYENEWNCDEKMLIFTEECGFVQVNDYVQPDKELDGTLNKFFKCSALVCIDNLSNNYSSLNWDY